MNQMLIQLVSSGNTSAYPQDAFRKQAPGSFSYPYWLAVMWKSWKCVTFSTDLDMKVFEFTFNNVDR